MRFFSVLAVLVLMLGACQSSEKWQYYEPNDDGYVPPKGRVFQAAGFKINEGQQIRDFFDDFEEPMHAKYVGNEVIRWTYYVDYNSAQGKGKIVRYNELKNYKPGSLCNLTVEFYKTYVTDVWSDCK
ncbi:MAG: hypothetical protein J6C85_08070 [Alphaproteobacteria bacterium]|nr:hypothetical protein [Alphaproteobacteria bacterium]